MLVPELNEALRLHDLGVNVVYGDLDNPETYRKVRVENAAMVAASADDEVNTHVAFSVREVNPTVPIAAQARNPASVDIMQLAGCSHVIQLDEKMGQGLCRRTIGNDGAAHIVAVFGRLVVAEATAQATTLIGKSLRESGIRNDAGMGVVGIWERGKFRAPSADLVITENMVLVMAGSRQQIQAFNDRFTQKLGVEARVVVIGGGRVGRATGRALARRGVAYRIVEKLPDRPVSGHEYVLGDAAELEVLQKAGIDEASTVIITTRDDNTNVYLSIYCRKLRPDILIVSRATLERNVPTLHRAGSDFVLSYASMGAGIMFNVLSRRDVYILDEELGVFSVQTPPSLVGRRLDESRIAEETNCRVVSINRDMDMMVNPEPGTVLEADVELILLASMAAEQRFRQRFVTGKD